MDALTLPQIADRVLVVRVLPEAGPPALPPLPVEGRKTAAGLLAGGLLMLLVAGLIAFALGRSRHGR